MRPATPPGHYRGARGQAVGLRGAVGELEEGVELGFAGVRAELAEGDAFYLAGPFASDAELTSDLRQGGALAAVEAVAALDEVALTLAEGFKKVADAVLEGALPE